MLIIFNVIEQKTTCDLIAFAAELKWHMLQKWRIQKKTSGQGNLT